MTDLAQLIESMSHPPIKKEEFDAWVDLGDIPTFLRSNAERKELIAYATTNSIFMNSVIVPKANVEPPDSDDLIHWNLHPGLSCGIEIIESAGAKSLSLSEASCPADSKSFRNGDKLIFTRSFEARQGGKGYCEILQKFAHAFDIHFVPERRAYCRLDKRGDVEDLVRITNTPGRGGAWGTTIVTFDRAAIEQYLVASDCVLLIAFDFTRVRHGFYGWKEATEEKTVTDDVVYRSHVEPGKASYMRGVHIVRPILSKEEVIRMLDPYSDREHRKYASFVALDWRKGLVREISTAPGATANYFTQSDLPFEISPAFFRPEVLLKYKADPEKYTIEQRSISCRNSWHLQTYDINEAGQVHTYIVYLRHLPYEEQLYWRSFNEEPKSPISKRAFTTDFKGEFHKEYEPLSSLKQIVAQLDHDEIPWWTLRSPELPSRVNYPVTASSDEWSSEILTLDQMVVEGFETKWLRQKATDLGRPPDPKFQSLKLTEECLKGIGFEEDHARRITAPLHKAHWLRSKLKGHAAGNEATTIRQEAIANYGTYGKHFRALCAECDEALRAIAEAFKRLN